MTLMTLQHLTLNTGHIASSDLRSAVDLRAVLPVLRPIVRSGGGPCPPVAGLTIQIPRVPAGAVFSIWFRGQPVALNCLAWNQASSAAGWEPIESAYLELTETEPLVAALGRALPEIPSSVPWLATLILPAIATMDPEAIGFLGDLERCLAAVILREHGLTW